MMWILAESVAPTAAPGGPMELIGTLTPLLLPLGIFYLLLIRPQQREQANRQAQLEKLKKDDEVVTSEG